MRQQLWASHTLLQTNRCCSSLPRNWCPMDPGNPVPKKADPNRLKQTVVMTVVIFRGSVVIFPIPIGKIRWPRWPCPGCCSWPPSRRGCSDRWEVPSPTCAFHSSEVHGCKISAWSYLSLGKSMRILTGNGSSKQLWNILVKLASKQGDFEDWKSIRSISKFSKWIAWKIWLKEAIKYIVKYWVSCSQTPILGWKVIGLIGELSWEFGITCYYNHVFWSSEFVATPGSSSNQLSFGINLHGLRSK